MNDIAKLTEEQRQLLLSKSAYVLPDNPSGKNFSPTQIKKKMYEGLLVLFDYINNLINEINANATLNNQEIANLNAQILEIVENGFKFVFVDELPETGVSNRLYFVPVEHGSDYNQYDEYIWDSDEGAFETVGSTTIDLSNYLSFVEVAGTSTLSSIATLTDQKPFGLIYNNKNYLAQFVVSSENVIFNLFSLSDSKSLIGTATSSTTLANALTNASEYISMQSAPNVNGGYVYRSTVISNGSGKSYDWIPIQEQVDTNSGLVTSLAVKTYVDTKITGAYRFRGSKTVSGVNALTGQEVGDIYTLTDSGTITAGTVVVVVGDNVIWNGTSWEILSSFINVSWGAITGTLSNQADLQSAFNAKQNKLVAGDNIAIDQDTNTISAHDTTYQSKSASSGGTDVSLVTTGEKYNWNNKSNFSGSYNDLSNKPTLFSGSYNDLSNKPSLFSGDYSDLTNKPTLATVATSGDYNDLENKPTIPTVSYPVTDVKVDGSSVMDGTVAKITMPTITYPVTDIKVDGNSVLSGTVALITTPTIPTVNNATLTIKANGSSKGAFTANASSDVEINITASDLGLSSAMRFVGVSSTDPKSSGATISGHSSWVSGEVVIYKRSGETNYEEYINLDGNNNTTSWELLGDADSYALKSELFSGSYNDLTDKPTIPTDTNQKIKAKNSSNQDVTFANDDVVEIVAGTNITVTPNATNKTVTIGTLATATSSDINGLFVTLISFSLEYVAPAQPQTITYQAPTGMTWAEWVASAYNTDGYTIYNGHVLSGTYGYEVTYNSSAVLSTDTIVADREYIMILMSGGATD